MKTIEIPEGWELKSSTEDEIIIVKKPLPSSLPVEKNSYNVPLPFKEIRLLPAVVGSVSHWVEGYFVPIKKVPVRSLKCPICGDAFIGCINGIQQEILEYRCYKCGNKWI